MPAIAHIGIGLGAKKILPEVNVGYLVLASEAVEVVFMILWALGIEEPPNETRTGVSMYSHSLLSGVILSGLIGILTWLISKNRKHTMVLALLVLSHTVMDVIASPMTAFYPTDLAKPIFYSDAYRVGFGLWRYKTLAMIFEYGFLLIGALIYVLTKRKLKKTTIQTVRSDG